MSLRTIQNSIFGLLYFHYLFQINIHLSILFLGIYKINKKNLKQKQKPNKQRTLTFPSAGSTAPSYSQFFFSFRAYTNKIFNKILNKNKERSLSLPLVELHPHARNPFSQFFEVSLPQLGLQGAHLSISNIYNNW